jgi:hypothetical protein
MCIYEVQSISEKTIEQFVPTRLAIKELAGVKYFCKSIVENIRSYPGSGIVWKDRIKKYGKKNIKTLWVSDWYNCPYEIQKIALDFSKENQIVESSEWANLKPENGLDGGKNSPESNIKNSESVRKYFSENPDARKNISENQLSRWSEESYVENQRKKQGESWDNPDIRSKRVKSMNDTRSSSEYIASVTGSNNPRYDHTIYSFTNGEIVVKLTQQEFIKKFNLTQSRVTLLVRGKTKVHKGWTLT